MERRNLYLDIAVVAIIAALLAAGLLGYLAALFGGVLVSLPLLHD
jgi:hypothetical protein